MLNSLLDKTLALQIQCFQHMCIDYKGSGLQLLQGQLQCLWSTQTSCWHWPAGRKGSCKLRKIQEIPISTVRLRVGCLVKVCQGPLKRFGPLKVAQSLYAPGPRGAHAWQSPVGSVGAGFVAGSGPHSEEWRRQQQCLGQASAHITWDAR